MTGNARRGTIILYVEDEIELLDLIAKRLQWEGYQVAKAANCQEAQEMLARVRPDLVILDLMLPDGSGLQILDAIRREPERSELPVIIMTGIGQTEAIEEGFASGANAYLTKPVAAGQLLEAVHLLLEEEAPPEN